MWKYENRLQFPVCITKPDIAFTKVLVTQIGGYAGELGACLRYFFQVNSMPDIEGKMLLTEIATEEMAHIEILSTLMRELLGKASIEEIKANGLEAVYAEHGLGLYPSDARGVPFTASTFAVTGNPIADLNEDLAAEAKARAVYEYLMDLTDNKEILAPLAFLREREIIHYQRFAELLEKYQNMGK